MNRPGRPEPPAPKRDDPGEPVPVGDPAEPEPEQAVGKTFRPEANQN